MLNFNEFVLNEEQNPAVAALEKLIKDKMSKIPDLKKAAKEGKKELEGKIASLKAQSKAYTEIAALMTRLSGEIARAKPDQSEPINIY
jgi:SMC interacting uncharacterized protein involved in chromosome segregation